MLPRKFSMMLLGPLLRGSGADQRRTFFRKNDVIFSHGDRSVSMFYIERGSVKLTVTSPEGKEAFIGFFDTGQFFGESCLSAEMHTRVHTATALTDVHLLKLEGSAVKHLLRTNPELAYAFISYLLGRNAEIQYAMANNLLYSSEERLKRVLFSLASLGQTDKSARVLKLKQQDLASIIGVSRQRINVLLKRIGNRQMNSRPV